MNSGAAFAIGHQHTVCQDYAVAGEYGGLPYALLCDGCSSASLTDLGARLLALSARKSVEVAAGNHPEWGIPTLCHDAITKAAKWAKSLELCDDPLLATLLVARCRDDKMAETIVCGDGVVVGCRHDGTVKVIDYSFPSNAPYYLAYYLNAGWRLSYFDKFGGKQHREIYELDSDFSMLNFNEMDVTVSPQVDLWMIEEFKTITVFSDGIKSFFYNPPNSTSKAAEAVHFLLNVAKSPIHELVSFKAMQGEFVKRRFQRALTTFRNQGWNFADDLSMATIFFGG